MKMRFSTVENNIPPTIAVPTECRPSLPAPLANRSSPLNQLFGKFDNQDGVLRRQSDEQDEADLYINVVDQTAAENEQQRTQHRHGHSQQNDERQRETLVLRRQRQVDNQQTKT